LKKIFITLIVLTFGACATSQDLLSNRELKKLGYVELEGSFITNPTRKDKPLRQVMYIGGMEQIFKEISEEIQYPRTERLLGIEGTVLVSFIVNEDGSLSGVEVLKSVSRNTDNEALRVIKTLDKWYPAVVKGKPVNVRFRIPIKFALT
jgi:TonB family protein